MELDTDTMEQITIGIAGKTYEISIKEVSIKEL